MLPACWRRVATSSVNFVGATLDCFTDVSITASSGNLRVSGTPTATGGCSRPDWSNISSSPRAARHGTRAHGKILAERDWPARHTGKPCRPARDDHSILDDRTGHAGHFAWHQSDLGQVGQANAGESQAGLDAPGVSMPQFRMRPPRDVICTLMRS